MFLLFAITLSTFSITLVAKPSTFRRWSAGFGCVPILIASEELSFPIRHFQGFGLYVPLASLGKPTPFWILELGLNEIM